MRPHLHQNTNNKHLLAFVLSCVRVRFLSWNTDIHFVLTPKQAIFLSPSVGNDREGEGRDEGGGIQLSEAVPAPKSLLFVSRMYPS